MFKSPPNETMSLKSDIYLKTTNVVSCSSRLLQSIQPHFIWFTFNPGVIFSIVFLFFSKRLYLIGAFLKLKIPTLLQPQGPGPTELHTGAAGSRLGGQRDDLVMWQTAGPAGTSTNIITCFKQITERFAKTVMIRLGRNE